MKNNRRMAFAIAVMLFAMTIERCGSDADRSAKGETADRYERPGEGQEARNRRL